MLLILFLQLYLYYINYSFCFILANNVTQQKLQCIKGEDGKLQFKGLLPGSYYQFSLLVM